MKLSYDSKSDILYMHVKDGPAESVREVEDIVVVELDPKGDVMGIELRGMRRKGILKELTRVVAH